METVDVPQAGGLPNEAWGILGGMSSALIPEPSWMNPVMRLGVAVAEKVTGRRLLPARLLGWYPRAAVSSGVMEALVAHRDGRLTPRVLHLVRLTASYACACPFCIDMNGRTWTDHGVTPDELAVIRGEAADAPTLTELERLAIDYARAISATPLRFDADLKDRLTTTLSEREIVVLASTAAQVNYWARLIQSLGIPPAGFSDACPLPGAEG